MASAYLTLTLPNDLSPSFYITSQIRSTSTLSGYFTNADVVTSMILPANPGSSTSFRTTFIGTLPPATPLRPSSPSSNTSAALIVAIVLSVLLGLILALALRSRLRWRSGSGSSSGSSTNSGQAESVSPSERTELDGALELEDYPSTAFWDRVYYEVDWGREPRELEVVERPGELPGWSFGERRVRPMPPVEMK